jgi:hypothetical protein
LDIDNDVLEAAKEISAKTKRTAGQIISELARTALTSPFPPHPPVVINGFEQIPDDGHVITVEFVRKLMEETEDQ